MWCSPFTRPTLKLAPTLSSPIRLAVLASFSLSTTCRTRCMLSTRPQHVWRVRSLRPTVQMRNHALSPARSVHKPKPSPSPVVLPLMRCLRRFLHRGCGCLTGAGSFQPNSGVPDEEGHYHETPMSLATQLERFIGNGWLNIVGGCCGTTPEHIRFLVEMVQSKRPRLPVSTRPAAVSGLDYLPLEAESRPVIVGEVTDVIGSKRFRDLISAE